MRQEHALLNASLYPGLSSFLVDQIFNNARMPGSKNYCNRRLLTQLCIKEFFKFNQFAGYHRISMFVDGYFPLAKRDASPSKLPEPSNFARRFNCIRKQVSGWRRSLVV